MRLQLLSMMSRFWVVHSNISNINPTELGNPIGIIEGTKKQ